MAAGAQKDFDELKAEFADLKSDMAKLTDTVRKLFEDTTDEGRERVREAAKRSREQGREALGGLEAEIGERPFVSLAAAFGIGFVIGKLLDR